jgi:hypothetical protein
MLPEKVAIPLLAGGIKAENPRVTFPLATPARAQELRPEGLVDVVGAMMYPVGE